MGWHPHERNLSRRYSILQQVATGTSLIQRGIQEHRRQKKDAPAKGRRADNTLIGGVYMRGILVVAKDVVNLGVPSPGRRDKPGDHLRRRLQSLFWTEGQSLAQILLARPLRPLPVISQGRPTI